MMPAGHVHLMGIGGIHMSAIAVLLRGQGWRVSGCDLYPSRLTQRLQGMGIAVLTGHDPCHLEGVDMLVHTAAVRPDNPELTAARATGMPVLKRAEMVARLAQGKRVVAVAGCHGKTTTTSLVAYILWRAGLRPTFLLGGEMVGLETNVMAGDGPHFVVEADEYDAAFLHYHPWIAAVTNVEPDHLDYYVTFSRLREAFGRFLSQVQDGGQVVVWGDDPSLRELTEGALAGRPVERTYFGLQPPCQLRSDDIMLAATGAVFRVRWRQRDLGTFSTPLLGMHNVRNCLAAIGVGLALGIEPEALKEAVAEFRGVHRRFEVLGEARGVTVVDDYAHHPTEVEATLAAARQRFPGRRLVCLFQPHTYSRSRYLLEGFRSCFRSADVLLMAETYAAREDPSQGMSAAELAASVMEPPARFVGGLQQAAEAALRELRPGDVFLTVGAGDVDRVGRAVLEALSS